MACGRWDDEDRQSTQAAGPSRSARDGVTIVELLVVIVIIGLLMAMLIPAVNGARESARQSTCANNLRQLGVGMNDYASRHNGPFCSGAFDWLSDGCVTETGWVADLVNQGVPVGTMLCPSNPAQLAATYNDLLSGDLTASPCIDKRGAQPGNPCAQIMDQTGSRQGLVNDQIYTKGYNTNYTASWFLVRSRVLLASTGGFAVNPAGCPAGVKSRNSTAGPLSSAYADSSGTPLSFIPLLGCGAASPTPLVAGVGDLPAETKLSVSMTGGPIQRTTAADVTQDVFSPKTQTATTLPCRRRGGRRTRFRITASSPPCTAASATSCLPTATWTAFSTGPATA